MGEVEMRMRFVRRREKEDGWRRSKRGQLYIFEMPR
jgi:hypothetical protein